MSSGDAPGAAAAGGTLGGKPLGDSCPRLRPRGGFVSAAPMARPCRLFALTTLSAIVLGTGCAGPPIPSPIEGLPVCPDFVTGNARMEGGLRFPVRLRVLEGKTVLYKTVLPGLRRPDDPTPKTFIVDDNAKYKVEWAQCSNPHAPRSVAELAHGPKAHDHAREGEGAAYDCGEAKVYKDDGVLETRKGDRASHVITYVQPPETACWTGEAKAAPAPAAIDAGAPPSPDLDAGAAPTVTDAGSAAPLGDAGATKTK
jgi:hypothetical protein